MNEVEVCNLALSRIGQGASKPVASLDAAVDTTEAARACQRVFAPTMAVLMEEYAWPFAAKAAALATTTQEVPGWEYVYAYPADCLFVHALSDSETDPMRAPNTVGRIPYKILPATSGESWVIATDLDNAWAWYTRNITNPHFAPKLFQDALAWRLAIELALALKADPRMAQNAKPAYDLALSKALAKVGNEEGRDREPDVDSIRAYS